MTATLTVRPTSVSSWSDQIMAASESYQVPSSLISSVMQNESGGDPSAVSSAGAIGLMQLMPGTAAGLGVNPWDATANINGGTSYLAQMFNMFGNWRDALAHYNAGPNNSNPPASSYAYADRILSESGVNAAAGSSTIGATAPASATSTALTGTGAGLTAKPSTTASTAQQRSWALYPMALVLVAGLVAFGIWGLVK